MSGKPNKTENDIIKHKNEYIERLNLEAEINQKNYDANKLYKETGQVMPIIGLADNRSIEDKLLDTENLKQNIAKTIGTISSLTFGSNVVQRIMENPLNTDNKLLIFTAQRINEIILNLKKIYNIGIRGDKNDVEQIVNFIVKMYTDANSFTKSVKNFFDVQSSGPLNPSGLPSFDSLGILENVLKETSVHFDTFRENYTPTIGRINRLLLPPDFEQQIDNLEQTINNKSIDIFTIMQILINIIPTRQELNRILEIARRNVYGQAVEDARELFQIFSVVFPNPNILKTFWDKNKKFYELNYSQSELDNEIRQRYNNGPYYDSIKSTYITAMDKVINLDLRMLEILNPAGYSMQTFQGLRQQINDFFDDYGFDDDDDDDGSGGDGSQQGSQYGSQQGSQQGSQYGSQQGSNDGSQMSYASIRSAEPIQQSSSNPLSDFSRGVSSVALGKTIPFSGEFGKALSDFSQGKSSSQVPVGLTNPQFDGYLSARIQGLSNTQLDALYRVIPNTQYLNIPPTLDFNNPSASRKVKELACFLALSANYNNPNYDPQQDIGNLLQGSVGLGVGKRRRGRPKGNGVLKPYSLTVKENLDLTRGIEPCGKFIKFGKYLLNSHKLNKENIFSLKHISGGNIIDIPSTRLTEGLGKVIKTIIGGGNPSYNDLNKLSENEQNYLHKVCSKSNIADKLSIPTPSKDSEEKEIHKFEVMKGEIASGNDSPQLIKDFKRMIMKLQKNNSLPKKEVYEILEELNSLGY